jgi:hypothetical protein
MTFGWVQIWKFLTENSVYVADITIWFASGAVALLSFLADGPTAKVRRVKRIVVSIAVTIFIWAAIITGFYQTPEPPFIQRHIPIPADYRPCGKT